MICNRDKRFSSAFSWKHNGEVIDVKTIRHPSSEALKMQSLTLVPTYNLDPVKWIKIFDIKYSVMYDDQTIDTWNDPVGEEEITRYFVYCAIKFDKQSSMMVKIRTRRMSSPNSSISMLILLLALSLMAPIFCVAAPAFSCLDSPLVSRLNKY